jgi:hypothetical protein
MAAWRNRLPIPFVSLDHFVIAIRKTEGSNKKYSLGRPRRFWDSACHIAAA